MTYCTGIRSGCSAGSVPTGTDSRYSSRVGPAYQEARVDRSTTLSPNSAESGTAWTSTMPKPLARETNSATMPVERPLVPVDEVHLVDRERHVADPEQPGDREVPAGLLDDAVAGVDEDQRELGGRGAGDHVAGVLDVARGVGEDVGPGGGREVPVGDVDGDALLALGAQAVGEQRQVGRVEAPVAADALDGRELVREHRLGVVEQPAHERGLPVVDGARRRQPEQVVPRGAGLEVRVRRRVSDRHQK